VGLEKEGECSHHRFGKGAGRCTPGSSPALRQEEESAERGKLRTMSETRAEEGRDPNLHLFDEIRGTDSGSSAKVPSRIQAVLYWTGTRASPVRPSVTAARNGQ